MPKFWTCRAVVNPLTAAPAFRLCLKPTTDGYHCAAHAAEPRAADVAAKVEKIIEGAGVESVAASPAVAVKSHEETSEKWTARRRAKGPAWPLNDDGSVCTPPTVTYE